MSDVTLMCEYVAMINRDKAASLCKSYGYEVDDTNHNHISNTLVEIIATIGDKATKDVFDIHPDKEVIVSTFSVPKRINYNKKMSYNQWNRNNDNNVVTHYSKPPFYPASGNVGLHTSTFPSQSTNENNSFNAIINMQTNTILIIGVIFIGAVLLFKN